MKDTNKKSMKNTLIRLSLIAAVGAAPLLVSAQQGAAPGAPTPGLTPSANSYNSQPDTSTTADTAGATPSTKHKKHVKKVHAKRPDSGDSGTMNAPGTNGKTNGGAPDSGGGNGKGGN